MVESVMQLADLLQRVDELKAEIDKLRPLKPEVEKRILQKLRLEWNYNSNAIEGNTLTLGETRALLMEAKTAAGKPIKDHHDIQGHNNVVLFLDDFIQQKHLLTEAAIREMHKMLLREAYKTSMLTSDGKVMEKSVKLGEYKSEPNATRTSTGEIRYYELPEFVQSMMGELLAWYHKEEESQTHPVVQAAVFHHRFLRIHPFDDGNGRLSRILMNFILMKNGFPPVVIKNVRRDAYMAALQKADAGEISDLMSYVAEELVWSEELYLNGARGQSVEDFDDVDKEIALFKMELGETKNSSNYSHEILIKVLADSVVPLFQRLDQKLIQFDEFYSEVEVDVRPIGEFKGTLISGGINLMPRTNLVQYVNSIPARTKKLQRLESFFKWRQFRRSDLGNPEFLFGLTFEFETAYYSISCDELQFKKKFRYTERISDEGIRALVNDIAKAFLQRIQGVQAKK